MPFSRWSDAFVIARVSAYGNSRPALKFHGSMAGREDRPCGLPSRMAWQLARSSGCLRRDIDRGFGELGERDVRFLLFVQRLVEQGDGLGQAEFLRPGPERAVARNLIVLDGLRRGQQACIERGRALV